MPALLAMILLLTGCRLPQISQGDIAVSISADGETQQVNVAAGSTVSETLEKADITLGDLDRVDPPLYTVLSDGSEIGVRRVREEFEIIQEVIPYEHQTVRNESLPEGETRLIEAGANGLQEITYRHVYEDGVEINNMPVKTVVLQEAKPEIVMVGSQTVFAPLPIPARLAYLAGGNAWAMDGSTGNRRALATSGDLDGRVFALSPTGDWLLYSRKSKAAADEEINTLWVVSAKSANPKAYSLKVANVVHFAAWVPGTNTTIAYSTVEPRAAAPGWQANNDLYYIVFSPGENYAPKKMLEANSGGVYGWWGTAYAWSPSGALAYARPDGVGLVDKDQGYTRSLLEITPLQTHSDWAWIPGLAWGADGKTLYVVTHAPPPSLVNAEESPYFDLSATSLVNHATVRIAQQVGMFAYPSASPLRLGGTGKTYQVAYLQAIFPAQSKTSRYRVVVMDRDGSNRQVIFPPADAPGLEPQTQMLVWAPEPVQGQEGDFLAVIYQGNLWLVDTGNGQAHQITGDGLISRIDWK